MSRIPSSSTTTPPPSSSSSSSYSGTVGSPPKLASSSVTHPAFGAAAGGSGRINSPNLSPFDPSSSYQSHPYLGGGGGGGGSGGGGGGGGGGGQQQQQNGLSPVSPRYLTSTAHYSPIPSYTASYQQLHHHGPPREFQTSNPSNYSLTALAPTNTTNSITGLSQTTASYLPLPAPLNFHGLNSHQHTLSQLSSTPFLHSPSLSTPSSTTSSNGSTLSSYTSLGSSWSQDEFRSAGPPTCVTPAPFPHPSRSQSDRIPGHTGKVRSFDQSHGTHPHPTHEHNFQPYKRPPSLSRRTSTSATEELRLAGANGGAGTGEESRRSSSSYRAKSNSVSSDAYRGPDGYFDARRSGGSMSSSSSGEDLGIDARDAIRAFDKRWSEWRDIVLGGESSSMRDVGEGHLDRTKWKMGVGQLAAAWKEVEGVLGGEGVKQTSYLSMDSDAPIRPPPLNHTQSSPVVPLQHQGQYQFYEAGGVGAGPGSVMISSHPAGDAMTAGMHFQPPPPHVSAVQGALFAPATIGGNQAASSRAYPSHTPSPLSVNLHHNHHPSSQRIQPLSTIHSRRMSNATRPFLSSAGPAIHSNPPSPNALKAEFTINSVVAGASNPLHIDPPATRDAGKVVIPANDKKPYRPLGPSASTSSLVGLAAQTPAAVVNSPAPWNPNAAYPIGTGMDDGDSLPTGPAAPPTGIPAVPASATVTLANVAAPPKASNHSSPTPTPDPTAHSRRSSGTFGNLNDVDNGNGDEDDSKPHPNPIKPELKTKLDSVFFPWLGRLCSDLDATDSKGEAIHQTLMAKKMQRLNESTDFRPFKFRIQAFTNAFHEELRDLGFTENEVPLKKVRQYLWAQPVISRFNDEGKKAKSKGNHVWHVEAKKDRSESVGWAFHEFNRKISGNFPRTAYIGTKWSFAPRVWDPQCSASNIKAKFGSPDGTLPPWLEWKDNVLSGTPDTDAKSIQIPVLANFKTGELERSLEQTFDLEVSTVDGIDYGRKAAGSSSIPGTIASSLAGSSHSSPDAELNQSNPPITDTTMMDDLRQQQQSQPQLATLEHDSTGSAAYVPSATTGALAEPPQVERTPMELEMSIPITGADLVQTASSMVGLGDDGQSLAAALQAQQLQVEAEEAAQELAAEAAQTLAAVQEFVAAREEFAAAQEAGMATEAAAAAAAAAQVQEMAQEMADESLRGGLSASQADRLAQMISDAGGLTVGTMGPGLGSSSTFQQQALPHEMVPVCMPVGLHPSMMAEVMPYAATGDTLQLQQLQMPFPMTTSTTADPNALNQDAGPGMTVTLAPSGSLDPAELSRPPTSHGDPGQ